MATPNAMAKGLRGVVAAMGVASGVVVLRLIRSGPNDGAG